MVDEVADVAVECCVHGVQVLVPSVEVQVEQVGSDIRYNTVIQAKNVNFKVFHRTNKRIGILFKFFQTFPQHHISSLSPQPPRSLSSLPHT